MKRNKKGQFVPTTSKSDEKDLLVRQAIFQMYRYQLEIEYESMIKLDSYGLYFANKPRLAP